MNFANFNEFLAAVSQKISQNSSENVLAEEMTSNRYFPALCEVLVDQTRLHSAQDNSGYLIANENAKIEKQIVEQRRILDYQMNECLSSTNFDSESELFEDGTMEFAAKETSEAVGRGKTATYSQNIDEIRPKINEYHRSYCEVSKQMNHDVERLVATAREILERHARFRPLSAPQIRHFTHILRLRGASWENRLKTMTCNQLMLLNASRSTGKKRRNFSKNATRILNVYFEAHMSQPYPSEAAKRRLAQQCGITLAQVSNWFGNKRIRFRKAFLHNAQPKKSSKFC